eukprot:18071-Heterococcus_DN1.PRE.2
MASHGIWLMLMEGLGSNHISTLGTASTTTLHPRYELLQPIKLQLLEVPCSTTALTGATHNSASTHCLCGAC